MGPSSTQSLGILPRAEFDGTLALLRESYDFIGNRCDAFGGDGFRTRLMLRDVVCLRGAEAVDLVYSARGLTRRGAMPAWVLRLLQDKCSVQQLEGEDHRRRKALFIGLLIEGDADRILAARFGALWRMRGEHGGHFNVLHDTSRLLARAAAEWCGLGSGFSEDPTFAEALFEMSDRAGVPGLSTWAALRRRRKVEKRLAREVRSRRRSGLMEGEEATPLAVFARAREGGALLSPEVVAVELLNLLRPIVAVGRYMSFVARMLIRRPDWRETFRRGGDDMIEPFCEEIRRISPFFPFTAAICARDIDWRGTRLRAGQWVIADLYGTCHDPALFPEPDRFSPERLLGWRDPAPGFAPQGAGDPAVTHRCPGEKVTVALMAEAVRQLCRGRDWTAPEAPRIDRRHIPARPEGGVTIDYGPRTPG